jgi:hypothetical protein
MNFHFTHASAIHTTILGELASGARTPRPQLFFFPFFPPNPYLFNSLWTFKARTQNPYIHKTITCNFHKHLLSRRGWSNTEPLFPTSEARTHLRRTCDVETTWRITLYDYSPFPLDTCRIETSLHPSYDSYSFQCRLRLPYLKLPEGTAFSSLHATDATLFPIMPNVIDLPIATCDTYLESLLSHEREIHYQVSLKHSSHARAHEESMWKRRQLELASGDLDIAMGAEEHTAAVYHDATVKLHECSDAVFCEQYWTFFSYRDSYQRRLFSIR